jgi:hypothetical protein
MTLSCRELFSNSVRLSGSGAAGQTVTVRAASSVVRAEVTDCEGLGVPRLRPSGSEAEGGRGLGLVAGLAAARHFVFGPMSRIWRCITKQVAHISHPAGL